LEVLALDCLFLLRVASVRRERFERAGVEFATADENHEDRKEIQVTAG